MTYEIQETFLFEAIHQGLYLFMTRPSAQFEALALIWLGTFFFNIILK